MEYFFGFSGLWIKSFKAPCKKRRKVTYFFLIVLLIFFPSRSSFKASLGKTKPVSSWNLDNVSAEAHTCSRGWVYTAASRFPFWCNVWYLGCLTAQPLKKTLFLKWNNNQIPNLFWCFKIIWLLGIIPCAFIFHFLILWVCRVIYWLYLNLTHWFTSLFKMTIHWNLDIHVSNYDVANSISFSC